MNRRAGPTNELMVPLDITVRSYVRCTRRGEAAALYVRTSSANCILIVHVARGNWHRSRPPPPPTMTMCYLYVIRRTFVRALAVSKANKPNLFMVVDLRKEPKTNRKLSVVAKRSLRLRCRRKIRTGRWFAALAAIALLILFRMQILYNQR